MNESAHNNVSFRFIFFNNTNFMQTQAQFLHVQFFYFLNSFLFQNFMKQTKSSEEKCDEIN